MANETSNPEGGRTQGSPLLQHPIWELAAKFAAPVTVSISAASYLAGYSYKNVVLERSGFVGSVNEYSVQDTIALGYSALMPFILAHVIFFWIYWSIIKKRKKPHRNPNEENRGSSRREKYRYMLAANIIALVLIVGQAAGVVFGYATYYYIEHKLRNDCLNSCYRIVTTRGSFYGIALSQSKDNSIFLSRDAAYLIPTASIRSVWPAASFEARRDLIRKGGR